jgi:hypothetical protein
VNKLIFGAIAGIIKGNGLPVDSVNEIFDQMRQAADWLLKKHGEVDNGANSNGQTPPNAD